MYIAALEASRKVQQRAVSRTPAGVFLDRLPSRLGNSSLQDLRHGRSGGRGRLGPSNDLVGDHAADRSWMAAKDGASATRRRRRVHGPSPNGPGPSGHLEAKNGCAGDLAEGTTPNVAGLHQHLTSRSLPDPILAARRNSDSRRSARLTGPQLGQDHPDAWRTPSRRCPQGRAGPPALPSRVYPDHGFGQTDVGSVVGPSGPRDGCGALGNAPTGPEAPRRPNPSVRLAFAIVRLRAPGWHGHGLVAMWGSAAATPVTWPRGRGQATRTAI